MNGRVPGTRIRAAIGAALVLAGGGAAGQAAGKGSAPSACALLQLRRIQPLSTRKDKP